MVPEQSLLPAYLLKAAVAVVEVAARFRRHATTYLLLLVFPIPTVDLFGETKFYITVFCFECLPHYFLSYLGFLSFLSFLFSFFRVITYLCVLGGGCCATRRYSSLPAFSFFPSIIAPSLPTILLSFTDEISTSDRPTDRCLNRISESPFTKRQADRPTDRRNASFYIDSWTKSTADRPTDRRLVWWSGVRSVGRLVGASVHQDHKLFMVSIDSGEQRPTDRPTNQRK